MSGKNRTLSSMAANLGLQIHASVGHPIELFASAARKQISPEPFFSPKKNKKSIS